MHASAVFDAARQELAWAYSGDFTGVPEPMKDAVDTISKVLNEAEIRWVTSTGEEHMAAAVDKENAVAVVATGHEEKKKKREDVGVVKEVNTRGSIGEAERKIKDWLLRLEEVAFDMRAVARKELLREYSRIHNKPSARWFSCLPITSRATRIAPTIDAVARDLEELKEQYDEEFGHSTGLPVAATCTEQPACSSAAGSQEETETSVTGDVLVGRDDDVRIINIINEALNGEHAFEATILSIVGPPCVGKTTLVTSVFHEGSRLGAGNKVWIDLRKGQGIKKIQKSVTRTTFATEELFAQRSIARHGRDVNERLAREKTWLLLVLDNLVEEHLSMLHDLSKFLHHDVRHVIAIMITQSEGLARRIAPARRLRMVDDPDDLCWEIIKRTSGLDLEATAAGTTAVELSDKVGREVASKCSGISLAAKALGRFLPSVDPQERLGLIRDVWKIGGGFSSDSQRLPIHSATVFTHLKHSGTVQLGVEPWLSLAYCAFVFPKGKGQVVVTLDLLNQWCSLGITTRERAASCISVLLHRSLLFGEKPASSGNDEETEANKRLLRMQDLMHEFARYHLGDRLVIVDGTNGAVPPTSSPVSSSAYLALVSNFDAKHLDIASILPAGILALRFEGCREMELNEGEFASAKYACLRLLDLSGCSVKKLPNSIGHLKQLRYLKALGIQDQELPRSISGLHELRYLILQASCQLQGLTEAFQWLRNLFHLDLSGCTKLKALPDSFGRLWRLEHLDLSASGIEGLPESFIWLRNLSHLDMSRCSGLQSLPESFGMLASLRHLDLSSCSGLQDLPTSFRHLTELRHLDLSGLSRLEALPMDSLPRELRHLNLSGCSGLKKEGLPDVLTANELRHLDMSGCSSVVELPKSYNGKLQKLVHLNLSGCSSLVKLSLGTKRTGRDVFGLPLKHLDLSYCSQLTNSPNIRYLRNLQYVDLSGSFQIPDSESSYLVKKVRKNRGKASAPEDASLRGQGTSGTTD